MRSAAVVCVLVAAGCSKAEPAVDLSTPTGAARCQSEAIRTKSTELWHSCLHPDFLDGRSAAQWADSSKVKRIGFWEDMAKKNAPLERVTDSDFEIEPSPDARYGDKVAKYRLDKDNFEVWHKNGRWYILDSGI